MSIYRARLRITSLMRRISGAKLHTFSAAVKVICDIILMRFRMR